jgi:hypothetical protein
LSNQPDKSRLFSSSGVCCCNKGAEPENPVFYFMVNPLRLLTGSSLICFPVPSIYHRTNNKKT